MKSHFFKAAFAVLTFGLFFTSCNDDDDNSSGGGTINPHAGAVYAMNNSATDNQVIAYGRATDGTLTLIGSVSTGGTGVGSTSVSAPAAGAVDPLGSNYALAMNSNNSLLFAVNAGSNEVSSFTISSTDFSLTLVETISSGGTNPISLAVVGSTLFVLNENGGTGQINSFTFDSVGDLTAVTSSTALSGRPLAIRASQNGSHLITTILPTDIVVHSINGSSLSAMPTSTTTVAMVTGGTLPAVPFGIETVALNGTQYVITSDARGGMTETSTVTSYTLNTTDGTLTENNQVLLGSSPTTGGELAACWVVADSSGSSLYTSNTNSSSISSFSLSNSGMLTTTQLQSFNDTAMPSASGLTDLDIVGSYVYQLYSAVGEVHVFSRNSDGTLTFVESQSDLVSTGGNQGIVGF